MDALRDLELSLHHTAPDYAFLLKDLSKAVWHQLHCERVRRVLYRLPLPTPLEIALRASCSGIPHAHVLVWALVGARITHAPTAVRLAAAASFLRTQFFSNEHPQFVLSEDDVHRLNASTVPPPVRARFAARRLHSSL